MKTRSPSVIVIGGGFAGISAARTLQDASFQVLFVLLQNQMQFHVLGRYTLETDFDHHRFLNGCVVFLSF